jgi:histidinol phosphatase-like enzyme
MKYRLIIFDADGTLRYCTVDGQPCPNRPDEWRLYPDVTSKLAEFNWTSPGNISNGPVSSLTGIRNKQCRSVGKY